ncbi:MAG: PHP domain-containing protein [Pseudomonadota bacterium]
MLELDFHCHSSFSNCGCHSILELLQQAKKLGLKGLAITDHGPGTGDHIPSTFFDRLHNPVPGITLLKGMECNLLRDKGKIDVLMNYLKYMDVVLLGIHPNTPTGMGQDLYTDYLLAAMEQNLCIDIITHLNTPCYPVHFKVIAEAARRRGIAIELNNSKTDLGRATNEMTLFLIDCCKQAGTMMVVNSDAHALNEIGQDEAVRPLLKKAQFPEELIVNFTYEKGLDFIQERKILKK